MRGGITPLLILSIVTAVPASAQAVGDLYVANLSSSSVSVFGADTAAVLVAEGLGGLSGATGLTFGPDGLLYVSSSQSNQVLRFDPSSGAYLGTFVGDARLVSPYSLIFGPDGDLYVSAGRSHEVLRFDGATGQFVAVVAGPDDVQVPIGLRFGPDELLYVASAGNNTVVQVDPAGSAPPRRFIESGLDFPSDLLFDVEGRLLVSNAFDGTVLRFDGRSGELIGEAARLPGEGGAPVGLAGGRAGGVYIADFGRDRIYHLSRAGVLRLAFDTELSGPENIAVRPTGRSAHDAGR